MNSAKTFQDFKEILKIYEIKTFSKFNVYYNPKGFLDEKRVISANMKLHWKAGLPYFYFGKRIYTCHHGKDKNLGKKRKYVEKKQEKALTEHIFQKTYNLTKASKKLDCPASITVSRVYVLPQLKLENPTASRKTAISAKIKSKLRNNKDVEGEEVFWFTLPSADVHKNHMLLSNPLFCSDVELLDNNSSQSDPDSFDEDRGCDDVIPEENQEETQDAVVYRELEKRGSKRKKLINECNSHIRNLGSILWELPESALLELEKDLLELGKKMQNRVSHDDSTD